MSTDRMTQLYNETCLLPSSKLHSAVEAVERNPLLSHWTGHYLSRPLFVEERQIRGFADDVVRMVGLLTSLPERLFDGDLDRFCAALGIDDRRAALMRRLGPPPHNGRADMYHDGTSFKLLEFGIASEVGGWDRAGEIPRAFLEADAFRAFAEEHGLGYTHPAKAVADSLRQVGATVRPDGEPVVVLLEGPGGLVDYGTTWRTFESVMRGFGLDFHVAEVGDVQERDGKLYLGSLPIDVVYRCFETNQIVDEPDGPALVEPLFRAHEAGGTVLWTPMSSNLFNDKGCMALLSDPRYRHRFTTEEQAVIDRVLPWTRGLGGVGVTVDEELIGHCRERREQLILKPSGYFGGKGTIPGWECSDENWTNALREAASSGCIVQERVVPRTEPMVVNPSIREIQPWQAVWGLFYTPDGYAGTYGRALPTENNGVIGISSNKGTRTAGVFHYSSDS
ncbi:hypothetical protein [Streptacidiphilus fuscans]|uniref:Circularly permuted type 2 ATP-grasp protein n=1 Tax=Streptacidiphilus fuscans TaxID=2789292 RepID=A0A931B5C0_9ACTN|nr:hypothetical protein [Streptacidiphilus fuscans]MBF9070644.1 hypothetical protein [Streptacidiphilus fuscans]